MSCSNIHVVEFHSSLPPFELLPTTVTDGIHLRFRGSESRLIAGGTSVHTGHKALTPHDESPEGYDINPVLSIVSA